MRSKVLFLVVLILSVLLIGGVFACKSSVVVPVPTEVMVVGDDLVWNEVPGAIEYHIRVDGEKEIVVFDTKYTIELYDSVMHSLTVSVVTSDGQSAESAPVFYTYAGEAPAAKILLSAPSMRISGIRLMWNNVQGNSGYRLFFDGKTIELSRNVTSYDLTFPKDGEYILRMQTVGDSITYYSSQKSELKVNIKGGKAKLLPLAAESISYDPVKKKIEWVNKNPAGAVTYEIYKDGILVSSIDSDDSKTLSYTPVLGTPGVVTSYTMRLASKDQMFDYSAFSDPITFPIAEPAVSGVRLEPEGGYYAFVWDKCRYTSSYIVTLDGNSYPVSTEKMMLPSGLSVGDHVVRVRSVGDNIYLAGSLSSCEVRFTLGAGGIPVETLSAPMIKSAVLDADKCRIVLSLPLNATGYRVRILKGDEKAEFDTTESDVTLLRSSTDPNIVKMFTLLDAGGRLSVAAYSDQPRYLDSPYCAEMILAGSITAVAAPSALTVFSGGVKWDPILDAENYYLSVDGEIVTVKGTRYEPAFTTGEHVFKVAVAAENCVFGEELFVSLPLKLEAPSALQVTSGVLSYVGVDNAAQYELFANGVSVGRISAVSTAENLSKYFEEDGRYVFALRAVAPSVYYSDSIFSEEVVYEKTDAQSGTIVKPYYVDTAESFVSLIAADPKDTYFTLIAEEYDFTNVDVAPLYETVFSGHIVGNGAVLKNLNLRTCLFSLVENAEISDLTFLINADRFVYDANGLFAKKIKDSVFTDVTFEFSGETPLATDVSFGLVAYEATDVTFDALTVKVNGLRISSVRKVTAAGVAYKLSGTVSALHTEGALELSAGEVIFGGVSREGRTTLAAPDLSLGINSTTASNVAIYGVTVAGNVDVFDGKVCGVSTLENTDVISYYGITKDAASVLSAEVGGTLTLMGVRSAEVFGIAGGRSGSIVDTTSTLTLVCTATERITAAGITERMGTDLQKENIVFAGSFDLTAPNVNGAAIAVNGDAYVAATVSGTLTASGDNALLTGGVLYGVGADITFAEGASMALHDTAIGTIAGAMLESSDIVSASGVLAVSSVNCGTVSVSGVYGGTEGNVNVEGLTIRGELRADALTFGGIADSSSVLSGRIASLNVDIAVTSNDLTVGGAIATVNSLDLTGKSTVTATITAKGKGQVGGFAADMPSDTVVNVLVLGSMSFEGEGELCGVVCRALAADTAECRADLTANGSVRLCGIAGEIGEGTKLTLSNAKLSLCSDQAELYGVAGTVSSLSAKVSGVTFEAIPRTDGSGSLQLFGMTDALGSSTGLIIENTSFTIGRFFTANFAAVANTASGSMRSGSFGYVLNVTAVTSVIGGVFGSASGTIDGFTVGTQAVPVTMTLKGNTTLGGIATTFSGPSFTVNNSSTDIRFSLDIPTDGTAIVGGAFATASDPVTMTGTNLATTLTERNGAGSARIGGAVAELSGGLTGARTKVSITTDVAQDSIGGIAAVVKGGSLSLCSSKGTLSAAKAGGLIAEAKVGETSDRPTVKKCATVVTSLHGAGLIYDAVGADIENCYSLATANAALVYSGKNVTIKKSYFGGIATYSVAHDLTDHIVEDLFVEASLRLVDVTTTGAVTPVYATLAYGSDVDLLAATFDREIWTLSETSYPYLTELGHIGTAPNVSSEPLAIAEMTDGLDLYANASLRAVAGELPAIVWVDQSDKLEINDGIVTLTDDGEGVLYGYISGGILARIMPYEIKEFTPFEWIDAESEYLISSFSTIKHLPKVANEYLETNGVTAHFRIAAGTYEDVEFPALTTVYAAEIDGTGVILVSPTVAAGGIFGDMTGGSIRGLTVQGAVCEDVLLFKNASNVSISDVSVTLTASGDVGVMRSMTGGAVTDVSLSVKEDGEHFVVRLIERTENVTLLRTQLLLSAAVSAPSASCSLVGDDIGSSFTKCAVYLAADLDEAYPFAQTANGTTVTDSSLICYGESNGKAVCSDKKEVAITDLTIRYCDCNVFLYDETTDLCAHKDEASVSAAVATAADDLAAAFAAFIANYSLTDSPAQWKLLSPSAAYDDYAAFYAKVRAFFDLADASVTDGASYSLTSGAIVGADKPFSVVFGEDDTTDALRTILARSFGYETAAEFAEKVSGAVALFLSDLCGTDRIGDRLVYDGAIYTANGYFVLPYAFKSGDTIALACVLIAPNGTTSVWLSDVASVKNTTNANASELLMMPGIATEAYGRCELFDTVRIAPVKRAVGVTYTDLLFAVNGDAKPIGGVTFTTFGAARTILTSAPYTYVVGALPTPVGYDRFGLGDEVFTITLTDDDGAVTTLTLDGVTEWSIYENWEITSDAPFGEAVTFTLTPALGEVSSDGFIRIAANGTGTLTVTNVYGESRSVTITVVNHYGFAHGSGTESDPYEIHTLADLEMMSYFEDTYFLLKEDVVGTLTAPIAVTNGSLLGDGRTIRLTLDGTSRVFSAFTGVIENVRFEIALAETSGGVLLGESERLTLVDVTFVLSDVTMNVGEGETVGLLFNEITGSSDGWSGVTVLLADVTVSAPQGGTVGLLVGNAEGIRMADVGLTASVTLTAGGSITFGGLVGVYGNGVESGVLLQDVTANVTLTGTLADAEDTLTLGGVVGASSVEMSDVTATVNITLNANDNMIGIVRLGGVTGDSFAALSDVTVDGTITVYAANAYVGGAVGYASAEITNADAAVTILDECAVRAFSGGVIGRSEALLTRGSATGAITAISHATDEDLSTLENVDDAILAVASAGGAVGYSEGALKRFTVSSVTVTATATGITYGYVFAGGAAGYVADASDLVVNGATLTASGTDGAAGGIAGVLKNGLDNAIVSDVTLTASSAGGAVGVFSFVEGAVVQGVFCTADVDVAIVDHVFITDTKEDILTGLVQNCTFLYGQAIGDALDPAYNENNVQAPNLATLYGTMPYNNENVEFDSEIWAFSNSGLPILKAE